MGAGIAQLLLTRRPDEAVILVERDEDEASAARQRVHSGLVRAARRQEQSADVVPDVLQRLDVRVGYPSGPVALAVEAVPELMSLKLEVLGRLARDCRPELLATNTSSLSVTALRDGVPEGTAFVGLHFFNPVPRSELIEVVRPDRCPDDDVALALAWCRELGKEHVVVSDSPGLATSRLGVAIALEAMRMVEQGVASPGDIDKGMRHGYKFPVGPLELTDRIGLDVRLAIAEELADRLGPRFDPPAVLRDLVASGDLGLKSSRGFYDWDGAVAKPRASAPWDGERHG
jgi:3-hydroxybutyryl-CoA dehydrogenase